MNGGWKGPDARRSEVDAVLGLTQVMTRRWLTSLSYSYSNGHGYENDPYKIISVVDPISGQPISQLYENRPDYRRKQSVYLENKVHLSKDIVEVDLRGYRDDWGIKSITADLRYRYMLPGMRTWSLMPATTSKARRTFMITIWSAVSRFRSTPPQTRGSPISTR